MVYILGTQTSDVDMERTYSSGRVPKYRPGLTRRDARERSFQIPLCIDTQTVKTQLEPQREQQPPFMVAQAVGP